MLVRRVFEAWLFPALLLGAWPAAGLPGVWLLAPPAGARFPAGAAVEPRGNALGFAGDPLEAAFVPDASGSMRAPVAGLPPGTTPLGVALEGLLALAASAPAEGHFALVTFATGPELVFPLGGDRAALEAAAGRVVASGQTDLLGGFELALSELQGPRARSGARRLEVVLPDARATAVATDLFGNFSLPPFRLLPGPNRFLARARFADGSAATGSLTLHGPPEPALTLLLGLLALARRRGRPGRARA